MPVFFKLTVHAMNLVESNIGWVQTGVLRSQHSYCAQRNVHPLDAYTLLSWYIFFDIPCNKFRRCRQVYSTTRLLKVWMARILSPTRRWLIIQYTAVSQLYTRYHYGYTPVLWSSFASSCAEIRRCESRYWYPGYSPRGSQWYTQNPVLPRYFCARR